LQVLSAFTALALVIVSQSVMAIRADQFLLRRHFPSPTFLSVPFTIAFCIVVGIRCAFEIPAQLEASWIFRFWLRSDDSQARAVARRALLLFTLPWLVPVTFVVTTYFFGSAIAALHCTILIVAILFAVEVLLVRYRKMPFTCAYPSFQSNSGLIL